MLHPENRKGCQKGYYTLIVLLLSLLFGCNDVHLKTADSIAIEDFSSWRTQKYTLDEQLLRQTLKKMSDLDTDRTTADQRTKAWYGIESSHTALPLIWLSRLGVDERADTLLAELHRQVPDIGFTERSFRLPQIEEDLQRMRKLDFDDSDNSICRVAGRLEYNLTKAYLRYVFGQHFGFTNPLRTLNRLDARETDSLGRPKGYRNLFDVNMELPGPKYESVVLRKVQHDSLSRYLAEVLPTDKVYNLMKQQLPTATGAQRQRLLVNMDRRRWREHNPVCSADKYIVVNVAAYHLWAVSPDSIVEMRAACGAQKTKTPLLTSQITHMELNPQWLIPYSIIKNDIVRHAGDSSYFARHRYFVADRKTGQHVSIRNVSRSMLMSGNYRVGQQGGAGNALGRIIFRFPNNFSVFLHDTSSPGVFQRDDRGVSHGCVRVQQPFSLACFLFDEKPDDWTLDKMRITMGMKPETSQGQEYIAKLGPEQKAELIRFLTVKPRVPIYITYYTLFPVPGTDLLATYPDVYGYDKVLYESMTTYLQ